MIRNAQISQEPQPKPCSPQYVQIHQSLRFPILDPRTDLLTLTITGISKLIPQSISPTSSVLYPSMKYLLGARGRSPVMMRSPCNCRWLYNLSIQSSTLNGAYRILKLAFCSKDKAKTEHHSSYHSHDNEKTPCAVNFHRCAPDSHSSYRKSWELDWLHLTQFQCDALILLPLSH